MLGWLYSVIVGSFCAHKWEIIKQIDVCDMKNSNIPWAFDIIMQCEKCGNIKKKRV